MYDGAAWPLLCCQRCQPRTCYPVCCLWTSTARFPRRERKKAQLLFSACPAAAAAHKPPPVSRQTGRSYVTTGLRILGDGLINHGVRQKHPALLTHADSSGATPWLAVLIALLWFLPRWDGARMFHLQERVRTLTACSPQRRAVPGTFTSCLCICIPKVMTWGQSESRTERMRLRLFIPAVAAVVSFTSG